MRIKLTSVTSQPEGKSPLYLAGLRPGDMLTVEMLCGGYYMASDSNGIWYAVYKGECEEVKE